ncbi:MAG: zinc-dependent alcohol dehydrogenase family protein [Chloroflexota bacterium]
MKAMLLRQPGPIEGRPLSLDELPQPTPGPGQVLIEVSACGLCHTDLHIVEGELPARKLPVVPGHQIVGRVAALGPGVTRWRVGERVGLPWLYSTCGQCELCQQEKENLCPNAQFTGYHADGGYAQYTVAPEDFAVPLPEGFPDPQAAPLLCAGIIGFRALRLSRIGLGQRLGLYGFGASAHIAIQVAVHWGCDVFVFSRSDAHRVLARGLGAVWTGAAGDPIPARLHSAIIFAPVGGLVPLALEALEPGGTLALAGIYMSAVPQLDYTRHLYHERTLRSVANATRQDARDFLRLADEIPVRTEVEVFSLDQANEALLRLKRGEMRGAGVLQITG